MYTFKFIKNKKILKSDLLTSSEAFFTTRETVVTHNALNNIKADCQNNLDDIAEYLNIEKKNIISPIQTHSSNINRAQKGKTFENTDALVTDSSDIAILLNFADCTPVIIADETKNVGAIAHAGWRGTAAAIVKKTVEYMCLNFNCRPSDMNALIGPSISMKNYQVDEEVFQQVSASLTDKYDDFSSYDTASKKHNLDLKTVNFHQLVESGLEIQRIDKCDYCTYDSNDIFFSYRKENGKTARHSAILKLNNTKP